MTEYTYTLSIQIVSDDNIEKLKESLMMDIKREIAKQRGVEVSCIEITKKQYRIPKTAKLIVAVQINQDASN